MVQWLARLPGTQESFTIEDGSNIFIKNEMHTGGLGLVLFKLCVL